MGIAARAVLRHQVRQCPECGAAWMRVTERGLTAHDGTTQSAYPVGSTAHRMSLLRQAARERGEEYSNTSTTVGWRPSCAHVDLAPVPQTICDPFSGSGTTLMVADRLGRNAIGCELSESYSDMGTERVVGDSPMFVELTS